MRKYTVCAAVVACAALPGSLFLTGSASGSDPARDRSCGWILEPTADRENILYPEITTRYLGAVVPVPPGGYVEIKGKFPHARYMSLQTYSHTLQSLGALHDEQIKPDPGSSNPYRKGANRNVKKRSYTLRIVSGRPPATNRPANTLYDQSADGSKSGAGLAYRIYLPDRKARPFGGVPAPALAFVLADGTRIDLPTCPDVLPDIGLTGLLAGAGIGNLPIPGPGLLAHKTPVWHKYVNAPTSYVGGTLTDNDVFDQSLADQLSALTALLPSGLGENADNKYVYAFLSREFGSVAVLRGKLPTTPKTYEGQPRMGSGQLRFWSMCTGIRTTQTPGCLVDKDIRPDKRGNFTIAISTAADRPANATSRCGVGWLPWGPDLQGIALMRNMLPAKGFRNAVQNAAPGTERKTLGAYYPRGTYFSTPAAFDRSGFVAKRCR